MSSPRMLEAAPPLALSPEGPQPGQSSARESRSGQGHINRFQECCLPPLCPPAGFMNPHPSELHILTPSFGPIKDTIPPARTLSVSCSAIYRPGLLVAGEWEGVRRGEVGPGTGLREQQGGGRAAEFPGPMWDPCGPIEGVPSAKNGKIKSSD